MVYYQIYYEQSTLIYSSYDYLYSNWNYDFIEQVSPNIIKTTKDKLNNEQTLDKNQLNIQRIPSTYIYSHHNYLKKCKWNEKQCLYKDFQLCIKSIYDCPISDIQISDKLLINGYQKVFNYTDTFFVYVQRENECLYPIVDIVFNHSLQIQMPDHNYQKLKNLEQETSESFQILLELLLYNNTLQDYNLLTKQKTFQQSNIHFSSQFTIQRIVFINQECSHLIQKIFKSDIIQMFDYFLPAIMAQFVKLSLFGYINKICQYSFPIIQLLVMIVTDSLFLYSTYYARIKFYFTFDDLVSSGCFEKNGEIYQMKQQFFLRYEIIGLFLSFFGFILFVLLVYVVYFLLKALIYLKNKAKNALVLINYESNQHQIISLENNQE
ncbi:hypothetical protein ABPG72_004980 [Tetrahymena utriculariae]